MVDAEVPRGQAGEVVVGQVNHSLVELACQCEVEGVGEAGDGVVCEVHVHSLVEEVGPGFECRYCVVRQVSITYGVHSCVEHARFDGVNVVVRQKDVLQAMGVVEKPGLHCGQGVV